MRSAPRSASTLFPNSDLNLKKLRERIIARYPYAHQHPSRVVNGFRCALFACTYYLEMLSSLFPLTRPHTHFSTVLSFALASCLSQNLSVRPRTRGTYLNRHGPSGANSFCKRGQVRARKPGIQWRRKSEARPSLRSPPLAQLARIPPLEKHPRAFTILVASTP
ncbi:hypothetical protein DFH07DRAFT_790679 [Mycena maculata]|uniref:Uncharacterized protein n=1 Tax=Mycena maculata TaxID=230809 RepID=A0AAD7NZR5_9AGAR|nr:hypothetical protein DFH07DRAFT_790679 [Mycena maculata]